MIKVGFIDYKNTIPFGVDSIKGIEIVRDVPSNLNRLIYEDRIDAGIISSAEYIQHYYKYFILPDLSISSKDKAMSVLVLSNEPIEKIDKIYLTRESKTSALLVRVVLENFMGLKPEYRHFNSPKNKDSLLVIGDLALRLKDSFKYSYDLGEMWYRFTGLPFVFALWCVRKEFILTNRQEVMSLHTKLKQNIDNFFKDTPAEIDRQTLTYLQSLDYSLKEEHIQSLMLFSNYLYQMKLIKSLPDIRFSNGVVVTIDGTKTMFNFEYTEAYHSTKAGAYTESFEKFVKPSNLAKLLQEGRKIKILDVGFGLGYNTATAINFIKQLSKNPSVEIVSIEKDPGFIERIKSIEYPDILSEEYNFILSLKEDTIQIGTENIKCYKAQKEGISLTVLVEEGRKVIKLLSKQGVKFDTVFYDPFSPKVNTEMWTVDLFRLIAQVIDDEGVFLTYSGAIPVKIGLMEAGFKIGYVQPVGRRTPSIIASKKGNISVIPEDEIKRLLSSEMAVAYRDPDFSLTGREIFENWERDLKSRQKPAIIS